MSPVSTAELVYVVLHCSSLRTCRARDAREGDMHVDSYFRADACDPAVYAHFNDTRCFQTPSEMQIVITSSSWDTSTLARSFACPQLLEARRFNQDCCFLLRSRRQSSSVSIQLRGTATAHFFLHGLGQFAE